jgi:hypothetical protein
LRKSILTKTFLFIPSPSPLRPFSRDSLDSVGIGGFSHDFRTLSGETPQIIQSLEALSGDSPSGSPTAFAITTYVPWILSLAQAATGMAAFGKLRTSLGGVAEGLLEREREREGGDKVPDKSIIGLLSEYQIISLSLCICLTVAQCVLQLRYRMPMLVEMHRRNLLMKRF